MSKSVPWLYRFIERYFCLGKLILVSSYSGQRMKNGFYLQFCFTFWKLSHDHSPLSLICCVHQWLTVNHLFWSVRRYVRIQPLNQCSDFTLCCSKVMFSVLASFLFISCNSFNVAENSSFFRGCVWLHKTSPWKRLQTFSTMFSTLLFIMH